MTSLSNCALPVAPRFEDPPITENVPPYISSTSPLQGSIVPAVNKTATFNVTFTDLNGDPLYVRWIAEYPQFTSSSHLLTDIAVGTTELPRSQDVSCLSGLALNSSLHPITVFVSDQPFWNLADPDAPTDPQIQLTHNKADSVMAQANWVLSVQCP